MRLGSSGVFQESESHKKGKKENAIVVIAAEVERDYRKFPKKKKMQYEHGAAAAPVPRLGTHYDEILLTILKRVCSCSCRPHQFALELP